MPLTDHLKFDDRGLVPVVVQDRETSEVLMFAHANAEAVEKTMETGKAHYWSRSRGKLWLKGESSGHIQTVREVRVDCDADCLLYLVDQTGGACHEGYRSCFFRRSGPGGELETFCEKVFDPADVY